METTWEELAPGVLRLRLPGWDETVGAVAGPEGVLVVDAGPTLDEGERVRLDLRRRLGLPVTHVVITHPHFDHVLGVGAFPGAEVYGAAGLSELLARDRPLLVEDAVRYGVDRRAAQEAADAMILPRHGVSGEVTLDLGGGREVMLANLGPAHTAHDVAVLVPGLGGMTPEVVFCGDLVEESGEPQTGPDAHLSWWPAALDRLLDLGGPDARYVPGHGAVVDAGFVRAQRDALAARAAAEGQAAPGPGSAGGAA
ncbi:MBL fold metallo-hydrolase [Streptomyces sodiiphilus]|uniref:MBL fold metallo-hydrolase n=1 Tax=Streptomyces sodiiphilus TaxID=226217 RepID=A0ABN2PP08_9ACTN